MRVYKDFYDSDMYDLLSQASESGHLSSECVSYDLSRLLYDYVEDFYMEEITEDMIYDFIRFEMEIQTKDEIMENYDHILDEYSFEHDDEITENDIEDFLSYHTNYVGNYEENGETFHVFTSF